MTNQVVERLEPRRLLAVSAHFDAATKTLSLVGSEQADELTISVFGNGLSVQDLGAGTDDTFWYEDYPAQRLEVRTLGGNDRVRLMAYPVISQLIDLGDGDDTFRGNGAPVTILGGAGNDTIMGTSDADLIVGGDSDDSLDGDAGVDTVDGGAGIDRASDDGIDTLINIEQRVAGNGSVQVTADGTLLVIGTDAADGIGVSGPMLYVNGRGYAVDGRERDVSLPQFERIVIRGLGGDDLLALAEPDLFPYPDITLDGGDGNDTFTITDAGAFVVGGHGDDVVNLFWSSGLLGFDDISGVDTINASDWHPGGLADVIDLRRYPTIENAINRYHIIGNDLDNLLVVRGAGSWGADVFGGKGNDIIISNADGGLLDGGEGDDFLRNSFSSFAPAMTLNGGAGRDTLVGAEADIFLNGEIINPAPPPNPLTFDSDGNATVTGSEAADVISLVILRPHRDEAGFAIVNNWPFALWLLRAGATISVFGKGGDDRIEMRASGAGVRAHFDGGDGNDTLIGGSYSDVLIGGRGRDLFFAREGNHDVIDGGQGNDKADADDLDELIDVKGKKNLKVKK